MNITVPHTSHYVYSYAYPPSMGGYVFYIGKGVGRRIYDHERHIKRNVPYKGNNPHKDNVIRKILRLGGEVEKEYLASFPTHDEALLYEIALIFFMRPYGHLTNLSDGGDGAMGVLRSEAYKERKRLEKLGKKRAPFSEEWIEHMSEAHQGQKRGSSSEEARQHMSEAQKSSLKSQAFREEQRARRARGELTEKEREHLRQMSEANKGRKRSPMSEETKRKISETKRKKNSQINHIPE